MGPGLGGLPLGQARFANGQWTMDSDPHVAHCPDGGSVPKAEVLHYTWDPNTLAGTAQLIQQFAVCGHPPQSTPANKIQLRQA